MPARSLTYGTYLRIPELLQLQRPRTKVHDEFQFIIIHQVFELWFRLLLHEADRLRLCLRVDDIPGTVRALERQQKIVVQLTQGLDVMETMTPRDFLRFRTELEPASGFQSWQFRELEFVLGARDSRYLPLLPAKYRRVLRRRLEQPSVWDEFVALLRRQKLPTAPEPDLVKTLVRLETDPALSPFASVATALFELDERFVIWRHRHIVMTERMIGGRPGTGRKSVEKLASEGYEQMGSGGVDYLRTTLSKKFFPLLWVARGRVGF